MFAGGRALTVSLPGHPLALGGGGLTHWLIRLFIWHEIWRLFRYLWRVPTFGPFIVIALILIVVGVLFWMRSRGRPFWRGGRRGGGTTGPRSGSGPRDW